MNANQPDDFSEDELAARLAAERLLRDGWRDKRWDTTVNPVKVSDRLRANLDAKARPDYVSLEVGQAQQGQIDEDE